MKICLAIVATMLLWSGGCAARPPAPEPVSLDRVECARCRMLISSETGAAEIVSSANATRFYDDVGCLAADWHQHGMSGTAFVRLDAGVWTGVHAAFYAQPNGARTAMASGFVASGAAEEARAADRSGRSLTWDEVIRLNGDLR
jgi:hypothetical protein